MTRRLSLFLVLAVFCAPLAWAQYPAFINRSPYVVTSPPQPITNIDAFNFVNQNRFVVTNLNGLLFNPFTAPPPFETSDTYNYTNLNIMIGDPGFRFDLFSTTNSHEGPSANFANLDTAIPGTGVTNNAGIFGSILLQVSATNVINRGTLAIGAGGVMKLDGNDIDLTRSRLAALGSDSDETNSLINQIIGSFFGTPPFLVRNVQDRYWGLPFDTMIAQDNFTPSLVTSPFPTFSGSLVLPYTTIASQFLATAEYVPFYTQLSLSNFTTYATTSFLLGDTNDAFIDMLVLQSPATNISTEVRFFRDFAFGGLITNKVVQFTAVLTNRVTGLLFTNQFYVGDNTGSGSFFFPFLQEMFFYYPVNTATSPFFFFSFPYEYYFLLAAVTDRPSNYSFSHFFPGWTNGTVIAPGPLDPTIFGPPNTVFYSGAAYGGTVTPTALNPDIGIANSTWTNLPGRIEINAKSALNLERTRMDGQTYLSLTATNHFIGSTNAQIVAPISDINLASTNGDLRILDLTLPTVPRFSGNVDLWSGNWLNFSGIFPFTNGNYFVTIMDAELLAESPSLVQNLQLVANNNLVIGDIENVFGSMFLKTVNLTIATNRPGAPTLTGEINIISNNITWSGSLPLLQNLTNYGKITTLGALFLEGDRSPPWFGTSFTEPYNSVVNHGLISAEGLSIQANYFVNDGTNAAGGGQLDLHVGQGFMTNGALLATNGDMNITGGSLSVSNHLIDAGRGLNINFSTNLDDGSLGPACADFVTNRNSWYVGDGINVVGPAAGGSLLATTVTNHAADFVNVFNTWSGADRGCSPAGFDHDLALGRMVFDGGVDSVFTFLPVPGQQNALYVDSLELVNFATNQNNAGQFSAIVVAPGMKIYFAQALAAGGSVAEKLNLQPGFCWVSGYNCGPFSSTNVIYGSSGVTNRLNTALVTSCQIASTPGILNCLNPEPVPQGQITPCNCTPPQPPVAQGPSNAPPVLVVPPAAFGQGTPKVGIARLESPDADASSVGSFSAAKGSYSGLFSDATNGVSATSSGYFSALTTDRGTFSARLMLNGHTYSFSGKFDSSGRSTNLVTRGDIRSVTVKLQIDLAGGNQLAGSISDGRWTAQLIANRASATKLAGNYTFAIEAGAGGSPAGFGFGSVKINANGSVLWNGVLADGSKVSEKTTLSSDGYWPLYDALYSGAGCAMSWLQVTNSGMGGHLVWLKSKSAAMTTKSYLSGFTNDVRAVGLPYNKPANGKRTLELNNGKADLILDGGGLGASITNSIELSLNNHGSAAGQKLTLNISSTTGLFKGAISNGNGKPLQFQGAVFQGWNNGFGFFLNPTQSGQVLLAPAQ